MTVCINQEFRAKPTWLKINLFLVQNFGVKYEGSCAAQKNPRDMNDGTGKAMDSEQTGVPGEEIDRSPPIGMFLSGESFFEAGRHLHRALELTLKAFLRAKGYPVRRLASQEFGHKVQVLWDT